jgi:uncharacterized membrane protein YkoI
MKRGVIFLAAALVGAWPSFRVAAAQDQDQARAAVQSGAVRPLQDVLVEVRRKVPGEVLDAHLKTNANGQPVYEIRILSPDGKVVDVTVSAR